MIIVTGGAGFIGSQLIKGLNERGEKRILVVDDLTDGKKFLNLVNADIYDYVDKDDFPNWLDAHSSPGNIRAIFHQGACSTTTEWNGKKMMALNYEFSKHLFNYCQSHYIPFIYASSAAVYGDKQGFVEHSADEGPLNVYGYSKLLFDQWIRNHWHTLNSQVVGLRYFNVYGPGEFHKGGMASVAYHLNQQLMRDGKVRLFEGSDGYADGEQRRDFIYVDDVVKVNLWFLDNPQSSGIFNCGTGKSQTFNEVAQAVINWHKKGEIEYIPFPEHLKGAYQSFTEANINALRGIGYKASFLDVASGVTAYLDALETHFSSVVG